MKLLSWREYVSLRENIGLSIEKIRQKYMWYTFSVGSGVISTPSEPLYLWLGSFTANAAPGNILSTPYGDTTVDLTVPIPQNDLSSNDFAIFLQGLNEFSMVGCSLKYEDIYNITLLSPTEPTGWTIDTGGGPQAITFSNYSPLANPPLRSYTISFDIDGDFAEMSNLIGGNVESVSFDGGYLNPYINYTLADMVALNAYYDQRIKYAFGQQASFVASYNNTPKPGVYVPGNGEVVGTITVTISNVYEDFSSNAYIINYSYGGVLSYNCYLNEVDVFFAEI